jgi:hypothetical protein
VKFFLNIAIRRLNFYDLVSGDEYASESEPLSAMMDQVRKLRSPTSPLSPASETEEEGRDGKFLAPLTHVHKTR